MKLPLSLIIDDPAPRVFVYYEHAVTRTTADGRPLLSEVPNAFLDDFCGAAERFGLRGKFSVVPMPGGRGDIVNGDADTVARLNRGFTNSIQTISLVIDPAALFDSGKGIYVNAKGNGKGWERPTMVEQIDPVNGAAK